MSINKAILIGNVGNAPEIKVTGSGGEIASFSIATTESWKDKNSGEKKDKTEWHRISVFSPGLVSVVKNYVKKGSKLYVEGKIEYGKYTTKEGIEKDTTYITLKGYSAVLQILDTIYKDDSMDLKQAVEESFGNDNCSDDEVIF